MNAGISGSHGRLFRRRKMKKIWLFAIFGTVAVLLFIIYLGKPVFFGKPGQTKKSNTAETQEQHTHSSSVTPQDAQEPASGPETSAEIPTVEIPSDKQQLIGVKTAVVSVQSMSKTIRTVGIVEYDQRKLNTINAKVEGFIEKLYINFAGAYVLKGEPVADIYSPELWATQQEYINLLKWSKQMGVRNNEQIQNRGKEKGDFDVSSMINRDVHVLLEAARQRLRLLDINDEQIRKIEESERPFRTLTLYSPYSGYVLQKNINQGMRVMSGQSLLDVVDLSSVWITADIYESELPLIKVGYAATVQLNYLPGKRFPTKIDYIYPTLEGETRTAKARFILPNTGGYLKPQMFTNVEMTINLGKKLVVPTDAVINTGVRQIVYVDKGDGNFEPREVMTGTQTDQLTEITAGLKAGDRVASSANFLIDSEAKLKGVEPLPRQKPQEKETPAKAGPTAVPPAHKH